MPKKSTFGKKQIQTLISSLVDEGIKEVNIIDLQMRIHMDFPNHGKDKRALYIIFKRYTQLFEDVGILVYRKRDGILKHGTNCINKAAKYIKNELSRDSIYITELASLLMEKYDFRLHQNKKFIARYRVYEILEDHKITLSKGKPNEHHTFTMLKEFSKTDIVQKYIKNEKKFTLDSISTLLKHQVSTRTLYNHSMTLVQLGIPIESNKITENKSSLSMDDIINKIATGLVEQKTQEIFAGKFAKQGYRYSLPILRAEDVLEYSEHIQKIFGIKILNKKIDKVDKSIEPITEVLTFLTNFTCQEPTYSDTLPLYNDTDFFIVCNSVDEHLEDHWLAFIQMYISSLSEKRSSMKMELLDEEGALRIDTENKKMIFLQHPDLHIQNLSIFDIIKLTHLHNLSANKSYQVHKQNMYIAFLLYLHSKELLLFPLKDIFHTYYPNKKVQVELDMFLSSNNMYKQFLQAKSDNRLVEKAIKKQRILHFLLHTLSTKMTIDTLKEEMVEKLKNYLPNDYQHIHNIFRTLGSSSFPPQDNSLQYTSAYYDFMKKEKYIPLIELFNKHMYDWVKLKQTATPKAYYRKFSGICVSFLKFLDTYHSSIKIDPKSLEKIFDFPDEKILTYQEHVDMLTNKKGDPLGDGTKNSKLYPLSLAFSRSKEYKYVFPSSKIPNYRTGSGAESSRDPIDDDEIILKLDEIVTHRPPSSDYFKNHKVHIDTSWWSHMEKVRPFEPLIIKLHLRIPARGKTLRLTDRDTLLVTNALNEITGFNFKSDKFKERSTPFIVPNIWQSELNFLVNLIEYNKHYFPRLSRVPVDDTTIPEGIMPLFPNDDGTAEFKNTTHLAYWGKVLMQAEIEFRQEGKTFDLVKSDIHDLPKTVEEMEMLTKGELATFKRKYDLHNLRHTGITRYITGGMPLELVRMLSGHSGYNTLLTIYYHVNQKALIDAWTKKEKIDPTAILNMHDVSDLFIQKKLREDILSEDSDAILRALEEEHFFNLSNRSRKNHEGIELSDIAKLDPLYYSSADGCGICPKRVCPEEFAGRCSLCPYFTTNYLFVEEIGLRVQLSMNRTKKFSELINKNRDKAENQKNKELKKDLLLEMENFAGWLEVLALANESYKNMQAPTKSNKESKKETSKSLTTNISENTNDMFIIAPALNVNHADLDTLSKAFEKDMLDNETVQDITNRMASKLIRHTARQGTYHEIESFSNEEVIRWFLPTYNKLPKNWHNDKEKQEEIQTFLEILEPTDKHLLQGTQNENTLLSQ